ncbi:39S ribosomal protein L51, mitochondrial [Bufo bufo]|uniref:39S ribosomal protein L51, mitochondrial n=1 Tax=Bufo bufo TaxID=8384 RepID=UPI001ABDFD13|nr:39S ribosomal protein L51, mitochondrial [Bufo bufo]
MWAVMRLLGGNAPLASQASRSFSLGSASLSRGCLPQPKNTDRWNQKRAQFGVYDNIGILGDFKAHPKHLIVGPSWIRGFQGNELQRCIRKKMAIGSRMFYDERHKLNKRISYLYRRFNRYGKQR